MVIRIHPAIVGLLVAAPRPAIAQSDAGCISQGSVCSGRICCPGLQCVGGEAAPSYCVVPNLSDAGCLNHGGVCTPVTLPDGGEYIPPCCPGTECLPGLFPGLPSSCRTSPDGGIGSLDSGIAASPDGGPKGDGAAAEIADGSSAANPHACCGCGLPGGTPAWLAVLTLFGGWSKRRRGLSCD